MKKEKKKIIQFRKKTVSQNLLFLFLCIPVNNDPRGY